jgi:hypothetical protein
LVWKVPEGWHRKAVRGTELGSGGSGWLTSAEAAAEGRRKEKGRLGRRKMGRAEGLGCTKEEKKAGGLRGAILWAEKDKGIGSDSKNNFFNSFSGLRLWNMI